MGVGMGMGRCSKREGGEEGEDLRTIGGRSSRYQFAGISTSPVILPLSSGFIHSSAFLL